MSLYRWERMRPMHRVCGGSVLPNAFNPTSSSGRFRPFGDGTQAVVPTMYAATRLDAAFGESIFHDVPEQAMGWTITRSSLFGRVGAVLIPQRELSLVDLTGWAHKRLRLPGRAIVECGPPEYATTALWAQRFHELDSKPDGIYWRSRQFDDAHAVMLFGTRVSSNDLVVVLENSIALWNGDGFQQVLEAAEAADVTIAYG